MQNLTIGSAPGNDDPVSDDKPAVLAQELWIHVFGFLDTPSLVRCIRVSREWKAAIEGHDDTLWRPRAIDEYRVQAPCDKVGGDHATWKALCKCQNETDEKLANGDLRWRCYPVIPTLKRIWRVQPDQAEQVLYCTRRQDRDMPNAGGLHTVDMATGELLSTIEDVPAFAHIEFSNGYVVATGLDESLHVYASRTATPPSRDPSALVLSQAGESEEVYCARQEAREEHVWKTSISMDGDEANDGLKRGELRLLGTLESPGPYRALRMVGRTLVVAGSGRITAWDIPTMTQLRTATIEDETFPIIYVEHDERHVFLTSSDSGFRVCAVHDLQDPRGLTFFPQWNPIIGRAPGSPNHPAFVINSSPLVFLREREPHSTSSCSECSENAGLTGSLKVNADSCGAWATVLGEEILACHFAGKHLVLANRFGITIIPNYAPALHKKPDSGDTFVLDASAIYIGIDESYETYLATRGESIYLLVNILFRVFLLDIDVEPYLCGEQDTPTVHWVGNGHQHFAGSSRALQVTGDSAFFSGSLDPEPDEDPETVGPESIRYPIHSISARHVAGRDDGAGAAGQSLPSS